MGRFKLWEILLFIAVVLLGAIAYETHKANDRGRYVLVSKESPYRLLDTHTGDIWEYDGWAKQGSAWLDSTYRDGAVYQTWFEAYRWAKIMPGPNSGIIDTHQVWDATPLKALFKY